MEDGKDEKTEGGKDENTEAGKDEKDPEQTSKMTVQLKKDDVTIGKDGKEIKVETTTTGNILVWNFFLTKSLIFTVHIIKVFCFQKRILLNCVQVIRNSILVAEISVNLT